MTLTTDRDDGPANSVRSSSLELSHIVKTFPGVQAVRDVSLTISSGEVVAVVGENGAGKSTLMRVASGVYPLQSYSGSVRLDGQVVEFHSVADAESAGIVLVSQEVQDVPAMTVAENIFLNHEIGFPLDVGEMRRRSTELLARYGSTIDPRVKMGQLGVGQRQMVMLTRALVNEAKFVIFDEPTASLAGHEVAAFFKMVGRLTASGVGCAFVSHRIDEVFEIADRIAIMRNGELVGIAEKRETTPRDVVRLMVGRELAAGHLRERVVPGDVRLELSHFCLSKPGRSEQLVVNDVSFHVRAGEIVGLFGLMGAGRTELASGLVGTWPGLRSGECRIRGEAAVVGSPKGAIRKGMTLLTEDRRRLGLFTKMNVRDNVNLGSLEDVSKLQVIDDERALARTSQFGKQLGIKAPSWLGSVANLSGGNQQKVLLARLLAMKPSVVILDEPTRGIDVGAKAEIFALLNNLTKEGLAVLLISSELNEVVEMSDRIVGLYKGRVVATFDHPPFDQHAILEAATGGSAPANGQ
jgi:D-xylose transport system ATP-binding protein